LKKGFINFSVKLFILLFFGLAGTAAFSDVTTSVCPEPRINGSDYHENLVVFFATILGSRNSVCGMYAEDKLIDVNPASISIPPGVNNSSCEEIQCRARNAEVIVTNAKTVIELSNKAVNGEIEIPRGDARSIRAGIRRIEKTIPYWETFILLRPYTEYTYVDAEEYIARSLEALTLRQAGLLPAEIINPYLLELRRLEEAERQRVAEERRRAEAERQRAEAERQRRAIASKIEAEEEATANMACIWTGTFDNYVLFLPFRHSNCLWNRLGIASWLWEILNIAFLVLLYKIIRRAWTEAGEENEDPEYLTRGQLDMQNGQGAESSSFFKKHNIKKAKRARGRPKGSKNKKK